MPFFKMPSTRPDFWKAKLARNRERDEEVRKSLLDAGWRILVIWECAIKGKYRIDLDELFTKITAWIRGEDIEDEIAGRPV